MGHLLFFMYLSVCVCVVCVCALVCVSTPSCSGLHCVTMYTRNAHFLPPVGRHSQNYMLAAGSCFVCLVTKQR